MIIEKLKETDIDEAKTFMLNVIKEDFGYDFNPEWHADISNLDNVYIKNRRSCFYIAKFEGKIIGTIAARPYDREYTELAGRYNSSTTLSIWRHYISRDMRGQGIGTKMLDRVESFAHNHKYSLLYLHTQKTIPGSLEYWLAKGFTKTVEKDDEFKTIHLQKII